MTAMSHRLLSAAALLVLVPAAAGAVTVSLLLRLLGVKHS